MDIKKRIVEIEARIAELPKGYVSRKMIGGKERLYLQWREGTRVRSRYIRQSEQDRVLAELSERDLLREELRKLKTAGTRYITDAASLASAAAESAVPYHSAPAYYLKWADEVIGEIDSDFGVRFTRTDLNDVVRNHAPLGGEWSRQDFVDFLQERIVSPSRRDIEQILFRCGLTAYDPIQIGLMTHAVSARDLFWIAERRDDRFDDAVTEVFESVFMKGVDLTGDSIDTPEGQNIKRYGVSRGEYGIYKQRLTPLSTDIESEIAVSMLAGRLGVPRCSCWRTGEDTVFSEFEYDFSKEYIVHFRRLIGERDSDDDLKNLIAARPQYTGFFARMTALDFITRQDDRHLSNLAVVISDDGEKPYPLYDNGRSLFYEDTEDTVRMAYTDVDRYATTFGPAGSYLNHVQDLSDMGISFRKLLRLDSEEDEVEHILIDSGFSGYRLDGSKKWIMRCIEILKELG